MQVTTYCTEMMTVNDGPQSDTSAARPRYGASTSRDASVYFPAVRRGGYQIILLYMTEASGCK